MESHFIPPIPAVRIPNPRSPHADAHRGISTESIDQLLLQYVLQNIREAVLFVGTNQHILAWNRAAETLFGIHREASADLDWLFSRVEFVPRPDLLSSTSNASVRNAIRSLSELAQNAAIAVDHRPPTPIDIHVVPMVAPDGQGLGSLIVIHDASYKVSLQRQVRELEAKSISDPLTGVANRAEFERVFETCCLHYRGSDSELSLIICDIDFFKRINDTYGHAIGDEALIVFASLLQKSIRNADFVARFGGEEFVILCNDCGGASAVECAEKIRQRLQSSPMSCLGQSTLSASFGVAQFSPDDSPSSFFARADHALLWAKEEGRNRVVLSQRRGLGTTFVCNGRSSDEWLPTGESLLCHQFTSSSPMEVLAAKLNGFVHDHGAEIKLAEKDRAVIHIGDEVPSLFRRMNDRRVGFKIDLQFKELDKANQKPGRFPSQTLLQISIGVLRQRDRRQADVKQQAEVLMRSLCSFLMLQTSQLAGAVEPDDSRESS